MKYLTTSTLFRPWALSVLFIALALSQTFVTHFSSTLSFDLIQFLDLSAFYLIPVLLWLGLFAISRRALPRFLLSRPLSMIALVVLGLLIVPLHRAFSLAIDFGLRFSTGLIDRIDGSLLREIYPHFLSSLPENYLIYLLFVALILIIDREPKRDKRIRVKSTEGYHWVDTYNLEAIYSDRNYVILQCDDERIKCRMTSRTAENLFSKYGITRVHRSVLIRPSKLVGVKYLGDQCYQFFTSSGKAYTSSARYKRQVERLIDRNSSLLN